MAFTASLLDEGSRIMKKSVDQQLTEFATPDTFCLDRGISEEHFRDEITTLIHNQLPIPVVFRREPSVVAYLVRVEKENPACENRKYTKGKRKTKVARGSILTFNFSFQNAVYPHPTSLSTDMLSEYLKVLGESKDKTKVGKLLKFEVSVTGDTPTSRGFRDLNIFMEGEPDPFLPFENVFTTEVCNFQKVPVGFIRHGSSLTNKKITELFSGEPTYMGTKTRYRRGVDKTAIQKMRHVQTAKALMAFPRKERLSLFFNAAPVARFYRKAKEGKVVEPMNSCIQKIMGMMGEKGDHKTIQQSLADIENWSRDRDEGILHRLITYTTDDIVVKKKKKDLFKVSLDEGGVRIHVDA